jgi:hypothetical protein
MRRLRFAGGLALFASALRTPHSGLSSANDSALLSVAKELNIFLSSSKKRR